MLVSTSLLALAPLAAAHFGIEYPAWRADSLNAATKAPGANQWIWPCANISNEGNRTLWPPTGGSIRLDVHHQWAPTYINIGIGNNVSSFNVSLLASYNQTGNGTFCLPSVGREQLAKLSLPNGTNATIQVVQISTSGNALYNCADITFSNASSVLNDSSCTNSTGVGGVAFVNAGSSSSSGNRTNGTSGGSGGSSGASSSAMISSLAVVLGAAAGFGVLLA